MENDESNLNSQGVETLLGRKIIFKFKFIDYFNFKIIIKVKFFLQKINGFLFFKLFKFLTIKIYALNFKFLKNI